MDSGYTIRKVDAPITEDPWMGYVLAKNTAISFAKDCKQKNPDRDFEVLQYHRPIFSTKEEVQDENG